MTEKVFYDMFTNGHWQGMSAGTTLDEAKKLVQVCRPDLRGRFTLVRWYGRNHPDNCKTSGGNQPDPKPEDVETKGKKDGHCNRQACQAPLRGQPQWFNKWTNAYYCQPCAFAINNANADTEFAPLLTRVNQ